MEDVLAMQFEAIGALQEQIAEIFALAKEDGFDLGGSARDCYMQLREERDRLNNEVSALEDQCADREKEIGELQGELDQMDKDAEIEAQERDDDISDALSDYLVSLGHAAKPLRSTGNAELDALIRAVWG